MKKIIYVSIALITLYSCDSTESTGQAEETADKMIDGKGHDHGDSEEIELNNGEKWKVEPKMMVHIQKMEKDVASFKGSELADYKQLSKELNTSLDLLTSGCTMTGKAHDELHKWLLPYIDLIAELDKAEKWERGALTLKEIKESFVEFNKYFQ